MDLKITLVGGQGDEKVEYVALQAKKDCNLSSYMIFDNTYTSDGSASNKHRHVFTFPNWEVKKDEIIILFTKSGVKTRGKTKDGKPVSYFYWGLKSSVWNEGGDKVHLIKAESAISFNVPSLA